MKFGKVIPQSSDNLKADTWVKVYGNTLTSAVTSVTISGLNGDIDIQYRLLSRVISVGDISVVVQPNNDTTSGNYGYQNLYGNDTSILAVRTTYNGFWLCGGNNNLNQAKMLIYAKSGYVRTAISEDATQIVTTTVNFIENWGQSWNNTIDNITSLVIRSSLASGLGIGSHFELWKPVPKV